MTVSATVKLSIPQARTLRDNLWREMTIEASDLGMRLRNEINLHGWHEVWELGVTETELALIERILGCEVRA